METTSGASPRKRILYFADPMCSWCWGFSAVIAAIQERCRDSVPIRLCVGGLRAFETRPMSDQGKARVRQHWQEVAAETGQRFNVSFFERERFVYDTEPACRAAVTVRSLAPDATLAYFGAVQHAFYVDNRDVTEEDVLADVARAFVAETDFRIVFHAPEVERATRADFALTQTLGIGGFPTVLLQNGHQLAALTAGWQSFATIEQPLRAWLGG